MLALVMAPGIIAAPTAAQLSISRVPFSAGSTGGKLTTIGSPKVWILEGGLEAWIKEGYPVTPSLSDPKERAASLGIQVLD